MGLKDGGLRAGGLRNLSEVDAIPASAVARWTFDDEDTSSGTAQDVWNNNDGTIDGASTSASGANQTYTTNEAYSFDGTDDRVTLPTFGIFDGTQSFTFGCWARTDALDGTFRKIMHFRGENNIYIDQGDNDNFRFAGDSEFVTFAPNADTWYHLVAVLREGVETEFYVDGSSVGTGPDTDPSSASNTNEIGALSSSDQYFAGDIDDPRIYDKALTDTEVNNWYNDGKI